MKITSEMLKQFGLQFSEDIDSMEFSDAIVNEILPWSFYHYVREYYRLSDEEFELYCKSCNIENSENFWKCSGIFNSKNLYNSYSIVNSDFVRDAEEISYSTDVYNSREVQSGKDIAHSQYIKTSNRVIESQEVFFKDFIFSTIFNILNK